MALATVFSFPRDCSNNSISFECCNWTANRGIYGSAVMITSQNGPNLERSENTVPMFSSVPFTKTLLYTHTSINGFGRTIK